MKLTPKEFNEQYKINADLQTKFAFASDNKRKTIASIAGKPKKMFVEIMKRFFTNPAVVIALAVFITILLCSILIPSKGLRIYEPNKKINAYANISMLPPLHSPMFKDAYDPNASVVSLWREINKLPGEKVNGQFLGNQILQYFKEFEQSVKFDGEIQQLGVYNPPTGIIEGMTIEYNPYLVFKYYILKANILDAVNKNQTVDENFINQSLANIPTLHTLLGTTTKGADIWTTTWYATWRAIVIALIAASLQTIIGVSIGAYLGFNAGKRVDTICMRLIDIFLSLPGLIWLLLFVSIFGTNSYALIGALVITGWAGPVSTTRMFIITVKDEEYIIASKSVGAKTSRQIFYHALPAILGKIATNFVRRIPSIIMSVASLAFLGFFNENNDISLGQLLVELIGDAQKNIWILVLPATILLCLSLSLHFIALGVHDALDPKVITKSRRK